MLAGNMADSFTQPQSDGVPGSKKLKVQPEGSGEMQSLMTPYNPDSSQPTAAEDKPGGFEMDDANENE